MTLPRPADHHFFDYPIPFEDGLTVVFRFRIITPSVDEEIMAAGDKRALERHNALPEDDRPDKPVTTVEDVAIDTLTAGISGFYTSDDDTMKPWDHELAAELWQGPDAWPWTIRRDLFEAVQEFAVSGRVGDPKA